MNQNVTSSPELFSDDWARAWMHAINESPYRETGASWNDRLLVRMDDGPSFLLDLSGGVCRSLERIPWVEPDSAGNQESGAARAPFVLAGPRRTWERVLSGELAPLMAVIKKQLRLESGSLVKLSRYAVAARDLLEAAAAVGPGGAHFESSGEAGAEHPAEPHFKAAPPDEAAPTVNTAPHAEAAPSANDKPHSHAGFRSTAAGGLQQDAFPMQLYHKAKRLGVWDPMDLDFGRDREDWAALSSDEQDVLVRLIAMFQGGEEAVTLDLLPLMRVISLEGRTEEAMYLTTFLFEEAKHTEFFRRFLDEVAMRTDDLSAYHTPAYRRLFQAELPAALSALDTDRSAEAQVVASTTYNMVVEGTLAETGYRALYEVLDSRGILPALREGVGLLQRDEGRHIAYGVHLLTRLIRVDASLAGTFHARMESLLPLATTTISELFAAYDPMPFGLSEDDFVTFAMDQFTKRERRILGDKPE